MLYVLEFYSIADVQYVDGRNEKSKCVEQLYHIPL